MSAFDIDRSILDFIKNNEDCTENEVRRNMSDNHICSSVNAHNRIKNLIKIGDIEDRKIGNSFHKLRLSDKTQFNRIDKKLDKIDVVLTMMIEPLQKIASYQQSPSPGPLIAAKYMRELVPPYFNSVFTMLWKLLQLSMMDNQFAKTDSLKLHMKIIDLIAKTTNQPFHELDHKKILDDQKDILIKFRQYLLEPGIDQSVANVSMVENLIRLIEKFETQFLN